MVEVKTELDRETKDRHVLEVKAVDKPGMYMFIILFLFHVKLTSSHLNSGEIDETTWLCF